MAFTDFFKPHWKHSNPAVRAASIRSLEEDQQPLLASIALLDAEPANRLIAARKVKHPDLLKKLKEQSADKNIQDLANKEWLQLQIAIAKSDLKTNPADAKETITLSQCRAALESLGENQKALEDVVKNSPLLEIRKLAFQKLTHATTIQTVAQNELDEALALQALAKISRDSQLESLAKNCW